MIAEIPAHRRIATGGMPISDGIAIDNAGNIYLGGLADNARGVAGPRLTRIDAFSFAADGGLYAVANRRHRRAALDAGKSTARPPASG